MNTSAQPASLRQTLVITGVFLLSLCIAIIWLYDRYAYTQVKAEQKEQLLDQLESRYQAINDDINKLRQQIRFIHTTPPIKGITRAAQNDGVDPYDDTKLSQWVYRLQTIFEGYIENNPSISQIRYIAADQRGRELVRVERQGTNIKAVEGERLQNKGNSDYFKAIINYHPRQIYISNITLNREYGRIQVPYEPTLRVAMPIFDDKNTIFGMVIININATSMLEKYARSLNEHHRLYLLNSEGGFVMHPEKGRAFHFEFDQTSNWKNSFHNEIQAIKPTDYSIASDIHLGQAYHYLTNTILLSSHEEGRQLTLIIGLMDSDIKAIATQRRNTLIKILGGLIAAVFSLFAFYQINVFKRLGLMRDQAEYEAIISGSNDGIIAMDENGFITSWNSAAETITEYSANISIGRSVFDLFLKNTRGEFNTQAIKNAFSGEMVPPFETHASTKSGKTIDISINLSPITIENGKPVGVAAIIRDITEKKLLDQKLIDLNLSLEKKVADRTKELEEARNQALLASETKSEFIANVSHEIRTPMNGVMGMLHLLTKDSLTSKQLHHVEMAKLSAKNLTHLINDILDMSKIEAGMLDIHDSEFNLVQMLSDVSSSLAVRAYNKKLEFIVDITEVNHETVIGDALRINQIITNLVGNALKFTEQGEISIRAETEQQDDSAILLRCSVQDTGKGIANDKLSHLFESFTQEDSSITKNFGGTGLGLTISRQLAHLMGGNIGVTSNLGKGSKFTFEVLMKSVATDPKTLINGELDSIAALIVSPNSRLSDTLCRQLDNWGAQAHVTLSIEALKSELAEASHWNTLLLDNNFNSTITADTATVNWLQSLPQHINVFILQASGCTISIPANLTPLYKPITPPGLWLALAGCNPYSTSHELKNDIVPTSVNVLQDKAVLLVDDNEINLEVGRGILEDIGVLVTTVNSGERCIQAVKDNAFELILMDCQMPDMDGYTTTSLIRNGTAGEHNQEIIILAMTAHAMAGAKETCISAGMNDFIPKPIDPDLLQTKLLQWVNQTQPPLNSLEETVTPEPIKQPKPSLKSGTLNSQTEGSFSPSKNLEVADWDKKDALRRVRNKEERLLKLIAMFLESMPERISRLEIATQTLDSHECSTIAHEIKGVASNLSCVNLTSLCSTLETQAAALSLPEKTELMQKITIAFERARIKMQNHIDNQ